MRFIFKYEVKDDRTGKSTNIKETEAITLDVILEEFDLFLRGCGYYPKGKLIYEEEE